MAEKSETRLRVRYAETDQMGVAHHASYLVWMEIGRVELARSRGIDYRQLEISERLVMAVIEAECRYLRPARFDQEIVVMTEVAASTARTIAFSYTLTLCDTGLRIATGRTRHIWLNRELRPSRLPEQYQSLLALG